MAVDSVLVNNMHMMHANYKVDFNRKYGEKIEKREQFKCKFNGKTKQRVTKENNASAEDAHKRDLNALKKVYTPSSVSTLTLKQQSNCE